eukprot:Rhum_TRINITY_DN15079_c11_g1::Rhum_TRINITY_DN15079_c11_g1_i1::g.136981::m.136981
MAELTQFFRSAFPSVDPVVVDAVCGRLGDPSAIGEALSAMAEPNGRDDAKRARHAKPAPAAATRSKHATAASYEPTPLAQILLRNIELRVGESPRRDAPSGATAAAAAAAVQGPPPLLAEEEAEAAAGLHPRCLRRSVGGRAPTRGSAATPWC